MEQLRIEVQEVMERELKRANDKFPLFNSKHEGLGVILEEDYEAGNEYATLVGVLNDLKAAVFTDEPEHVLQSISRQGVISSIDAACELIQVAAMFNKFRMSMSHSKTEEAKKSEFMKMPQEKLNDLVDRHFHTETTVKRAVMLTTDQMKKILKEIDEMEEENEH